MSSDTASIALPAFVLLMNSVSPAIITSETTMERNVSIEMLRVAFAPSGTAEKNTVPALSVTAINGGIPATIDVKFCAAEPKISRATF